MLKVALFSIVFLTSIETTHYIQTYKIFINKCKRYVIFFTLMTLNIVIRNLKVDNT